MARFLPSADRRQTTDHRPAFSPLQDLRLFVSEEASRSRTNTRSGELPEGTR